MSAQHVTQNKVLINHMWEGARVCLWQQFHASLERLATKTDILTSTVRIRRWQSQSWHEENLRSYEKAMATSFKGGVEQDGQTWRGETERGNVERQHLLSFLTGTESGAEVKPPLPPRKRGEHQLIPGNQPTNQPLAPYCLKTATILLLHSQFSLHADLIL